MHCSYYALHSVRAYRPNQLTWHNVWLQFQAGMHVRWRWCIRRIWACTVRWLRWPFDGAFGVSYRKWTYTCVNMPSINRISTKVSMLYHLLTRYLLLFIHTIFPSFWLLGNPCYVQMCFLGHCNCKLLLATKLTRAQHEDYGNATMLHCGFFLFASFGLIESLSRSWFFQSGFLEEVNSIYHDTVLWL